MTEETRQSLQERANAPDAQREQRAHNGALKRHYAPGTRVRSLKTGREGVIIWYGRDRKRRVLGQGLVRLGIKWDDGKTIFRGTDGIVRADGLTLADTKARRTAPARQFRVRTTTGFGDSGLLHGERTLGDDYLTDDEFERISAQVREHNAGVLIHEVAPGSTHDINVRERKDAWREAKRLARLERTARRPGPVGVLFIGLDGRAERLET